MKKSILLFLAAAVSCMGAAGDIEIYQEKGGKVKASLSGGATMTSGGVVTIGALPNPVTVGTGSLSIAAGKTFTASNTITLTGTDGASLNISNAVVTTGSYANPAWITSLAATKLTGTIDDARLSANVPLLGAASNEFGGDIVVDGDLYIAGDLLPDNPLDVLHGGTGVSTGGATGVAVVDTGNFSFPATLPAGKMGALLGDVTSSAGSYATTVGKINGVSLAGLATGILKNTTTTGQPSIAVAGDFPTLNQNTTGSAATLTTPRAIYGNNFDGSAALTQIMASTFGGTGNGFTKISGPATTERTKTMRDANDTVLELGGSYTPTGTWTNMVLTTPNCGTPSAIVLTNASGTASININGTVGATTPTTGAFTTGVLSSTLTQTMTGLGASTTNGLISQNTTSAANGAQQYSPALVLIGQGWATGGGASSAVQYRIDVEPVQGSSAPTGTLSFKSKIGGGAESTRMTLADNGALALSGNISSTTTGSGTVVVTGGVGISERLNVGGATIHTVAGAASLPSISISGAPYAAGTATTNFPLVYINESTATASTTLSTSGTDFGINTHLSGDLCNFMLDGVSKFKLTSAGALTLSGGGSYATNGNWSGNSYIVTGSAAYWGGASGVAIISDAAFSALTRVDLGGSTNSFSAIARDSVNSTTIQSAAGTATYNDPGTANSGTVANRYVLGVAAPTFTSTGTSVTNTVGSTVYIGGAPTASTNTTITTPYALNVAAGVSKFGGPPVWPGYTVAGLPSTAATGKVAGAQAMVTDATLTVITGLGLAPTGGGANTVPVYCDGTNWLMY